MGFEPNDFWTNPWLQASFQDVKGQPGRETAWLQKAIGGGGCACVGDGERARGDRGLARPDRRAEGLLGGGPGSGRSMVMVQGGCLLGQWWGGGWRGGGKRSQKKKTAGQRAASPHVAGGRWGGGWGEVRPGGNLGGAGRALARKRCTDKPDGDRVALHLILESEPSHLPLRVFQCLGTVSEAS